MAKVIFILIDGLGLTVARQCMSFLTAMTQGGKAMTGTMRAFLPPLSRPAYASILSGKEPLEHGIFSNEHNGGMMGDSFFHLASKAQLKTAAAAYCWFYELCTGKRFDPMLHRSINDVSGPIRHGIFYHGDNYPDAELFADAESLRVNHEPDLLLAHCMGVDFAGHQHGGGTARYLDAARNIDGLLSRYAPLWLDTGHRVLLTSDHGMDSEGSHYDDNSTCRDVPFWLLGDWRGIMQPVQPTDIKACLLAGLGLEKFT